MPRSRQGPFPPAATPLDAAVRTALDTDPTRTDPRSVWDKVARRLDADAPTPAPPRSRFRWRALGAGLAAAGLAAAVLVAIFLLPPAPQALAASPAEVVQAARAAHDSGPDRCYTQTVTPPPGVIDPLAHPPGVRRAVIWVRGDQFVAEPGLGGMGAWGRDAEGRIWVAPTREAAARFTPEELPPGIQEAAQVRGLELDKLLDGVLAEFDLAWADPSPSSSHQTISATRRTRAGPFQVTSAELIVENDTHLIQSLILRRMLPAGGVATVAFERDSHPVSPPVVYAAEGYLDKNAPVYDAQKPRLRRWALVKHLGRALKNGP